MDWTSEQPQGISQDPLYDSGSFNIHDSKAHRTLVLVGIAIAAFGYNPPRTRASLGPSGLAILTGQQTLTAHMTGGKNLGIGNND